MAAHPVHTDKGAEMTSLPEWLSLLVAILTLAYQIWKDWDSKKQ